MDQHLKILGWLHVANGAILMLIAIFVGTLMTGIGAATGEAEAFAILAGISGAVGIFFGILALPSILGGWGLLTYRPWSRILVLVLSFLNLMNFPMGTLLGAYGIWALSSDESRRLLESGGRRQLGY